jgi:hypothetical protein
MKLYLLAVLTILAGTGCSRVHDVRVVEIYQQEVDANDGVVQKEWRTTIESDTGHRAILFGKYAATTGETFKADFQSGNGWTTQGE